MKNQLLFFLTGFILLNYLLSSCASKQKLSGMQTPQNAQDLAHHLFDIPDVHSGLYMVEAGKDLAKQKPVIDFHSTSLFTPASNTKILTLYASLKFLPAQITGLQWLKGGEDNNITYIKGTGDPGFLDPRFDSKEVVDFLNRKANLFLISDWSSEWRWGPGWSWDDYPYYYAAQRSPFPVYGNVVRASCQNGTWSISPGGFILNRFADSTAQAVTRNETGNIFQVNQYGCTEDTLNIPFVWSPEVAVRLLADTLHKTIGWSKSLPPEISPEWMPVPGSGRDTLLRAMMYESDNLIAEQMLWNVSSALWDTISTGRVIDSLMKTDFHEWRGKVRWVDGSGLSVYNKLSPRFLVEVLHRLYGSMPAGQLLRYFAAGGERGTIASWYDNDGPAYVYAKTGTLSGVHCLSGFLLANSGRTYLFSFMHNNFLGSGNQYKVRMEQLLEWIKEKY